MRRNNWSEWWRARRADVLALSCVVLFFVAFFPNAIAGRRFIIAGDALYYSYPLRTVAWQMIRHGTLPLWTPYVLSGYPLLSMAQVAIGYPLTWGYLFWPGPWAEQVYVLAPFLLAPMFTYAYARELGRSRLASLLAGLAFAYGEMMCGAISNSGMLTNSLMWTPLLLIYVDRARTRPLAYCLPRAAFVYALAVLAGHGQSYVYVGVLAACYGLFLSLSAVRAQRTWLRWAHWRPLFVSLGALLLAAGVAAFQLLEALRAAHRSTRSALTYEIFGEGSFTPREALRSIGAPLYHYLDTSAYLAPLALLLAIAAVISALRGRIRDQRLWFWLAVALVSFVFMLGAHTPLYRIVYHVPVLNQFRVPSRHTFEWTLAVSIFAAYGWDEIAGYFARRRTTVTRARRLDLIVALALLAAGIVVGVLWWRATSAPPLPNPNIYTGLSERAYWLWKLAFTCVVIALTWWCFRLSTPRTRNALLGATIMLACFAESSATVSCWWLRLLSLPASRLQIVSPTTRYLQQFPPAENRVYTRATLFAEEFNPHPRLDAPNLPALYGFHNVAGMEPLIFERYSRALGGVGPDSVTPRPGFPPNDDLLSAKSHVLDMLNTTHVVSFANLKTFEDPLTYKDGIGMSVADLGIRLPPGESTKLTGAVRPVDQLALVTALENSASEAQGATVARVRLHTTDGRVIERELRAGFDTAEWAHERPDVRATLAHSLAPTFDGRAGDAAHSFVAYRYWARFTLDAPEQIALVEIVNVTSGVTLDLARATLFDSRTTGISTPLVAATRSAFWTTVYDRDQVQILHNTRALPRAWLVTEAQAVDGEEALQRIRGESKQEFDPRRTVLLEVTPDELPALPGGELSPQSTTRMLSYEPNHLLIETDAPTATVLVLSEIIYPGWEATVDGHQVRINVADFLLRAVALPAGKHRIELRYTASAARNGAIISAFTLLLLGALFVYERRTRVIGPVPADTLDPQSSANNFRAND